MRRSTTLTDTYSRAPIPAVKHLHGDGSLCLCIVDEVLDFNVEWRKLIEPMPTAFVGSGTICINRFHHYLFMAAIVSFSCLTSSSVQSSAG